MAIIKIDRRAVEYQLDGQGDVVVLCSPNFWPLDTWQLSGLPELRDAYRVLAFNNRGYGASEATSTAYTVYSLAADTLALMAALGIARAHLVGFAYGAQVALKAAARQPERVTSLVLGAAAVGWIGPWVAVVVLGLPRLWKVLNVYAADRPTQPPTGWVLWPLWYVSFAFIHTRRAGALLVIGLFLNIVLPIKLPWLG